MHCLMRAAGYRGACSHFMATPELELHIPHSSSRPTLCCLAVDSTEASYIFTFSNVPKHHLVWPRWYRLYRQTGVWIPTPPLLAPWCWTSYLISEPDCLELVKCRWPYPPHRVVVSNDWCDTEKAAGSQHRYFLNLWKGLGGLIVIAVKCEVY